MYSTEANKNHSFSCIANEQEKIFRSREEHLMNKLNERSINNTGLKVPLAVMPNAT